MINLNELTKEYPKKQKIFKKAILREYFQYKILDLIFQSKYSNKLIFLGGTALKLVYNNPRFSEVLDFDKKNLNKKEFIDLSEKIKTGLKREGYNVEVKNTFKDAFRSRIKILDILFDYDLSSHKREKMVIQVDTAPQTIPYKPKSHYLQKFEVFRQINVAPLKIILSKKIVTIFERNRSKGRDFFDIVFLFSKTKPDFDYLSEKIGVNNMKQLKNKLKNFSKDLNFKALANDVEPFLFDSSQKDRVLHFSNFIDQL
ncbi:MAG TPA: nucleotidyl transferase AbiEii/AbiGii toxin family protein [Patescibacteria group bacterium]|nr:nucleotidyl transferase AbiEii/AbiGii toxin family protein [Patescibacteria group bacterium]